MRYGSVCSGIEAASVAWEPLGWTPAWFCEIDAYPSAVLKARFPHVPNYGDFTQLIDPQHEVHREPIDVLVGGTPCVDFSVAGLRAGIEGSRGQLTLQFLRLAQSLRPRWVVWENVPGVLSSDDGRALGAFLGGLAELGYGFAWRVLDAQYVRVEHYPRAVPQRRRRIFVVGCAGGDWLRAGSVLLEPEGVRGNLAPRREAGKGAPAAARRGLAAGSGGLGDRDGGTGGGSGGDGADGADGADGGVDALVRPVTGNGYTLDANYGKGPGERGGAEREYLAEMTYPEVLPVVGALTDGAHHGGGLNGQDAHTGRIFPVVAQAGVPSPTDFETAATLDARTKAGGFPGTDGACGGHVIRVPSPAPNMVVRRLTPVECERLQAFPDGWTQIAWKKKPLAECPDGPRYKALGNSMAVNCMAWIGQRIVLASSGRRTYTSTSPLPPRRSRTGHRKRRRRPSPRGIRAPRHRARPAPCRSWRRASPRRE